MLAAIRSAAVRGVEALDVTVEVDVAPGLPAWTIVGLPGGAVKEARERVSAAILNSGFDLPSRRVTVNLSPADVRKEGTAFDLPIALGLLVALGRLEPASLQDLVVAGELGLDGSIRPVRGSLPIAAAAAARGVRAVVLPEANGAEALLVRRARIVPATTLGALVACLRAGRLPAMLDSAAARVDRDTSGGLDFAEVVGQPLAKRALEIAAAGCHNVMLLGPPGTGKTMLARRLPGILPPLDEEALLDVVAVHSVAGVLPPGARLSGTPPFRAPHHTISIAGLIGGGPGPRPGEVSLAHRGVLFLDELLELPRYVLDAMRQPLEDGRVVIARAAHAVAYPARFQLVGAANPCPCGRAGDGTDRCQCSEAELERYRSRLSGPLADRIDLHATVGNVEVAALASDRHEEASATIRARVLAARDRQSSRYRAHGGESATWRTNAEAAGGWLLRHGGVTPQARALLDQAASRLGLSARAYHRALRVARTIADLDGVDVIGESALAEALRYRPTRG